MKEFLKRILPGWALRTGRYLLGPFRGYHLPSYSQEGEDMVLRKIFERKVIGFYVDIGACHPRRFSNTCYFYLRGWSGVNVDATPGSMNLFRKHRPRDVCIEAAVSCSPGELKFYVFDEPVLNTSDESLVRRAIDDGHSVLRIEAVGTRRLDDILSEAVPVGQTIDFMTVDVEGMDLDALRSGNWELYRPQYLLVERLGFDLQNSKEDELCRYLAGQDYALFGKLVNTLMFSDLRFSKIR